MKTINNYLAILFIACCLIVGIMSCGETSNSTNKTSATDTSTSIPKTTNTTVEPPVKNINGTSKTVVFKDVKTYSGASYYFFTDSLGKTSNIRVSSFESDDRLQMPANLLLPKTDENSLPKVNPAMIGKSFKLTYNERGKVVAVEEN